MELDEPELSLEPELDEPELDEPELSLEPEELGEGVGDGGGKLSSFIVWLSVRAELVLASPVPLKFPGSASGDGEGDGDGARLAEAGSRLLLLLLWELSLL